MVSVALLMLMLMVEMGQGRSREEVSNLFFSWSKGGDFLSSKQLYEGLSPEVEATEERVRDEIMTEHDRDGDGFLSFSEFSGAFPVAWDGPEGSLKQGHLSLGGTGTSMWIMWITSHSLPNPTVRWSHHSLNHSALGTSHTYDVGFGGFHQMIHQAEMTGLVPGVSYSYQFGHDVQNGPWSKWTTFQMPSQASARIAILADQGTIEPLGSAVARQIAGDCIVDGLPRCDAVHICGDLAYAWRSATPGPEEQWIWDLYQEEQTVYALQVPQMTTIGNHEEFANATAFANRYRMPSESTDGKGGNFYFSYNVGPVHMIAFSTDGPPSDQPSSAQYQWLVSDLAAVDRAVTPWVVFTTHRPVWCSSKDEFNQHAVEDKLLEPVFLKYHVDLVVTGHMHVFERIFPNIGGVPVVPNSTNVYNRPTAPAYVVQGTGGCLLSSSDVWMEPKPVWSATRANHYGYAMLEANATHLHYSFRLEKDGSVFDDFWILK